MRVKNRFYKFIIFYGILSLLKHLFIHIQRWDARFIQHFVAIQHQGTQFSLNAKIGYIFSNGFDINLSVNNMTNYRYYDNFYQVDGTSLYAQCAYRY